MNTTFDPLASPQSLDDIAATHDLALGGRVDDPSTQHALLVPKGWRSVATFGRVTVGLGIFAPVGGYFLHPSPSSPALAVCMARFAVEFGLEDVLRHRAAAQREELVRLCSSPGPFGERLQALSVTRGGVPSWRVTTAVVDNGRLVLVDAMARVDWWPHVHAALWPCGTSLRLRADTGTERLGPTRHVAVGVRRVELPAEWSTIGSGAPGQACARLIADGRALAWIGVREVGADAFASAPVVDGHVARVRGLLQRERVAVGCIEALPAVQQRGRDVDGGSAGLVLAGTLGRRALEIRTALIVAGDAVLELVVIGPALRDDLRGWLRAKRAFELAVQSAASG